MALNVKRKSDDLRSTRRPELPRYDPVAVSRAHHDSNFTGCESRLAKPGRFSVGLFSGIGGIERGLGLHGGESELLAEFWEPARRVLTARFPDIPLVSDVRDLRSLPRLTW